MDGAEDATISILIRRSLDACLPSGDDLLDARHVTTQLNIDVIAAVPQAGDCGGCRAEHGVCAQIVLTVRYSIEERPPARINETGVGGEVDRSIVLESSDRPPAVVEILGVPRSDSSVCESIFQHSIPASRSGAVLCQTMASKHPEGGECRPPRVVPLTRMADRSTQYCTVSPECAAYASLTHAAGMREESLVIDQQCCRTR